MLTLGNAGPQGKKLSLEMVKLSLLNEETRRKDKEFVCNHKTQVIEGDSYRGMVGKEFHRIETGLD